MSSLRFTACVDSDELARQNQRFLGIRYEIAKSLGRLSLEGSPCRVLEPAGVPPLQIIEERLGF